MDRLDGWTLTARAVVVALTCLTACDSEDSGGTTETSSCAPSARSDFAWSLQDSWSWGGSMANNPKAVALSADAIYIAGEFAGQTDLAPGDVVHIAEDEGNSNGDNAVFLSKLTPEGAVEWAAVYPGARAVGGENRIVLGDDGAVFLSGRFSKPTDFDPGPGVDMRDPGEVYAGYVTRLESDGSYTWTQVWEHGVPHGGEPFLVMHPDGFLLNASRSHLERIDTATGDTTTLLELDMDGGAPVDLAVRDDGVILLAREYQPIVGQDAIPAAVEAYAVSGELLWRYALAVNEPSALEAVGNEAVVLGSFAGLERDTALDAAGEDIQRSFGHRDVFATRLDANGQRIATTTWGGVGEDMPTALTTGPEGTVFVIGTFHRTLQFSDGTAGFEATGLDSFLVQLGRQGDVVGLRTWGAGGEDEPYAVTWSDTEGLAVVGIYDQDIDVSSTPTPDVHDASGYGGALLQRFQPGYEGDEGSCRGEAPVCVSSSSSTLNGTDLPRDFDDCFDRQGGAYTQADGSRRCTFSVAESSDPEVFDQCVAVGGGIIELEPGLACKVVYDECGRPCFGNFCD